VCCTRAHAFQTGDICRQRGSIGANRQTTSPGQPLRNSTTAAASASSASSSAVDISVNVRQRHLVAGEAPGRDRTPADESEWPEQPVVRHQPLRRIGREHVLARRPAEQQRFVRPEQPRRRHLRGARAHCLQRHQPSSRSTTSDAIAGHAGACVPQGHAGPPREIAVGRRPVAAQVPPGQLRQRHLPVDDRAVTQPVAHEDERPAPCPPSARARSAHAACENQQVHQRLPSVRTPAAATCSRRAARASGPYDASAATTASTPRLGRLGVDALLPRRVALPVANCGVVSSCSHQ